VLQVLQRLGLAFTWSTGLQPSIGWLPALADAVAVEPVLARVGVSAAVEVAIAPVAILCALVAALAWCLFGVDAGARRASLVKSARGSLLWRSLRAASSWLFIPLLAMLLSVFSCGSPTFDPWSAGGYVCWTGAHLALTIINSAAAVVLTAGGVYLSAVTTSSPLHSTAPAARSHGRAAAGAAVVDTLLVVVLCAFRGKVDPTMSSAIALLGAGAWLCISLAFLPHVRETPNAAVSAAMSAHVWVAACGLMSQIDGTFSLSTMLVVGLLPSVLSGAGLAEQRWHAVSSTPIAAMTSVYSFEIRVGAHGCACRTRICDECVLVCLRAYVRACCDVRARQARALVAGRLGAEWQGGADRGSAMGADDRAALHALFEEALAKFGKTATVLVMIAGFHLDWDRNVYLTLKHCNAAMALEPSADEAVRIRVLVAVALEHEATTVAGAAAARTQLEFHEHITAAGVAVLALARGKQKLFAGLRAAVVNLAEMLAVSREITKSYESAAGHYKAALALLPSSIGTMRSYVAVMISMHDKPGAAAMLVSAEALEETLNKRSARVYRHVTWKMSTSFDVALESNGVIQVSIAEDSLGTVLAANAEACRMFGYSQQVCACRCVAFGPCTIK
jgi:hypothetical protein